MKRSIKIRKTNKTIYILTQGTVTEPEYFKYIKDQIHKPSIKIISLHCTNALQFVEKALKIYKDEIINYDEFWIVFEYFSF